MSISKTETQPLVSPIGHFDDSEREYVITDPRTPYPWINYLGGEDFVGLISNTAGGYAFYRDARLRRLTRYRYNSVPADDGGRYFYIRDGDTVWSPGWKPVKQTLDQYECRHGLGYTKIRGSRNGLTAEALFFVPPGCAAEIHRLTLTNGTAHPKRFQLFSFVEWCLWNAFDDTTNFQRTFSTGQVAVEGSLLIHSTEYRERRNHFAFYSVDAPMAGFDTDRDAFLGLYNGFDRPDVVFSGAPGNSIAHGWSPIASHCLNVELGPGEETQFVFLLGFVENEPAEKWTSSGAINTRKAHDLVERFAGRQAVDEAYGQLRDRWQDLFSSFSVTTGDVRFDRLMNIWNPYQCAVTFNVARSASLFESGISRGIGFRDSNQDVLGAVLHHDRAARERILDLAATQSANGSTYHQYQPLTKRGNAAIGSGFNDDPLWLIASTAAYVKETGDLSILDERVPFENSPDDGTSLLDHLQASFNHVLENLGPHGLPLIGRADWNDCLNLNLLTNDPDDSFQTGPIRASSAAESVMIAGLFVWTGKDYLDLCRLAGREAEALRVESAIADMVEAVDEFAWDGEWFLRAYRHDGRMVGSHTNDDGKIFIEPQAWCVMAGIGLDDGRARSALDSVRERLDSEVGVVLVAPAFAHYDPGFGEVSAYPPGYKENGSVFCHTNPWIVIAETAIGRGDRAFQCLKKFAPAFAEEANGRRRMEPYVFSQMIAGPEADRYGEAKNSWLTGAAAWSYVAATQYILGIRPEIAGLRIDPCIPSSWSKLDITRRFRGATYDITVTNPDRVQRGVKCIEVDETFLEGTVLPLFPAGTHHRVHVVMG